MARKRKPPDKEKLTWDEINAGRKKPTRAKKKKKRGEDFERAVHAFASNLDPNAEVLFNHNVKDVDTGELRQCDVWINGLFGGHLPFSFLVSCKDHKSKLHVGDIDTFIGEVHATNADMGVICSKGGFNDHAIRKARINRISCCRLFSNESFEITPSAFLSIFHCVSVVAVRLIHIPRELKLRTWNDLFDSRVEYEEGTRTIGEFIAKAFHQAEKHSLSSNPTGFPPVVTIDAETSREHDRMVYRFQVTCGWSKFRAKDKAILASGSYNIRNNLFAGHLVGPPINVQSGELGPGWEEIADADLGESTIKLVSINSEPTVTSVIEALKRELGEQPLPPDDPSHEDPPCRT